MKTIILKITLATLLLFLNRTDAQTVWNGPVIEFIKQNNADPSNLNNQDIITASVALTRGNNGEIYNATLETVYLKGTSPLGTEWAIGDLSEIESLTFSSFRTTVGKPRNVVGKELVLHILEEDVYLSVEFTSWSQGKLGGFSYKRSTNNITSSVIEDITQEKIRIFPNPCIDNIQIEGINQLNNYEIFDVVGSKIGQGTLEKNKLIEVKYFKKGIYFLRLENGKSIRFLKK